jgi:CubicO group peptidase (beta-lactamase class C family)
MTTWRRVAEILEAGLSSGVYTAAVLLAGRDGEVIYKQAFGRLSSDPGSPAATPETVFDLASITKTLATTLAILLLVQTRRLSLSAALGDLLPWLPADKACLPLMSLLTHQSGLPAWKPFYQTVLTLPADQRSNALERLAAVEPLEHTPGKLTIYSDLGFMLLKAVVEAISGQPLDAFCRRHLYEPLGLKNLGFRNIHDHASFSDPLSPPGERVRVRGDQPPQYAATEVGLIPGRTCSGQVHDENAWSAGGVAGHAGLFGTGSEVFQLAAHLYKAFTRNHAHGFLDPEVVRTFLTPPPDAVRALGFDVPAAREASCGRFFSPNTVGHLGFTGVSYWIDLDLGQIVVLLTNRVHLGRDNDKIKPFRPRVYEAASRALGLSQIYRN